MSEYTPIKANLSTVSTVAGSASSVVLLASNPRRKGASIVNASTALLYVRLSIGSATTTTGFNVVLDENDYFEIPAGYTGQVSGIWASATGSANMVEYE